MERVGGLWHFNERSADRLWHKSAIGRPSEGGGILMSSVELLFCVNHRNIDAPSQDWLKFELENNSNMISEYAAMEALRVPGNKVVMNNDQWKTDFEFSEGSWAMRWPSNSHPRDGDPVSEILLFNSNDEIDVELLNSWHRDIDRKGIIAEVVVVDEEGSAVTYRISNEDPTGKLGGFLEDSLLSLNISEISSGGYFIHETGNIDSRIYTKYLQGGIADSTLNALSIDVEDNGARVLIDLLGRGLNPKSGFKYGTKWRCYEGEIGMGHAPWLIVHPDKIPNDWNEACLASRLASGVNKKWLMPIIVGSKIEYLSISRPPADARWSSPR